MRTVLIAALLAGVAAPAIAGRPNDDSFGARPERPDRTEARGSSSRHERPEARESRLEEHSADRSEPRTVERPSESFRGNAATFGEGRSHAVDAASPQVDRVDRHDAGHAVREWRQRQQAVEARENDPERSIEPREVRPPRNGSDIVSTEQTSGDTVRNWRARERRTGETGSSIEERNLRRAPAKGAGRLVETGRTMPGVFDRTERRISRTPVRGTEPPAPRTATGIAAKPARHWRSDWRHDDRYDWRDWRRRHRSHFHLGSYYDPFGWDYLRYGVGWRLWPNYYRNSFWLNDPWQYRLPPAYGPYRWVRYYNDALLVNIYTGEVVDVEYNFFW